MQEPGLWHSQVDEVGAQAHARACAFPKLSEIVGAVIEGDHGRMKALLSPHFVKGFSCLCRVCAGVYTYGHCVACRGFPSARCKALVPGLARSVVYSIWE